MERGAKAKASRTLSKFVREIALEQTEQCLEGDDPRPVSKAEKLARLMWKMALGWTEIKDDGKEIAHKPDKGMMALLWDRLEGKVPQTDGKSLGNKASAADRVGEQSRKRLNKIAGGIASDSGPGNTEAPA